MAFANYKYRTVTLYLVTEKVGALNGKYGFTEKMSHVWVVADCNRVVDIVCVYEHGKEVQRKVLRGDGITPYNLDFMSRPNTTVRPIYFSGRSL